MKFTLNLTKPYIYILGGVPKSFEESFQPTLITMAAECPQLRMTLLGAGGFKDIAE